MMYRLTSRDRSKRFEESNMGKGAKKSQGIQATFQNSIFLILLKQFGTTCRVTVFLVSNLHIVHTVWYSN